VRSHSYPSGRLDRDDHDVMLVAHLCVSDLLPTHHRQNYLLDGLLELQRDDAQPLRLTDQLAVRMKSQVLPSF